MKWEGLLPLNGLLRKAAIVSGSEVTTTTTSRRRKKSPSYRRSPLIRNPSDSSFLAHCDVDHNKNSSPSLWPVRPVVVLNWDQVICVFKNFFSFFGPNPIWKYSCHGSN